MKPRPSCPAWWIRPQRETLHHRQGRQASGQGHAAGHPTGKQVRRLGFLAGQFSVPDDFDEMGSTEIERMFGVRVKLLLDTHLLLWAANEPKRLPKAARVLIEDLENDLLFSAASMWEITIKCSLGREDFRVDARLLRRGLLDNGYTELPITSEHAINVDHLPSTHKDPFDRILVAQATVEGITLLTNDRKLVNYPGPIRKV